MWIGSIGARSILPRFSPARVGKDTIQRAMTRYGMTLQDLMPRTTGRWRNHRKPLHGPEGGWFFLRQRRLSCLTSGPGVLKPSGEQKGRILHCAFEVTFGLSLRSWIQTVSQKPEHFVMHCLARPLSQGPDQWLCFLIAGFRDDAATNWGVRAFNVRSECNKYDWSWLIVIIILKYQNVIWLVCSRGSGCMPNAATSNRRWDFSVVRSRSMCAEDSARTKMNTQHDTSEYRRQHAMLHYAMLRHAMAWYDLTLCGMLCYAMLCYAMLCYAMLCYAMPWCGIHYTYICI